MSGYLRRRADAADVRAAVAAGLGVAATDVLDDTVTSGDPVAWVEVSSESGEYPTRVTAFVDAPRAPAFVDKAQLLAALAQRLDVPVIYDDGSAPSPDRWIRVDPDGVRFEVFEDPSSDELRIDPARDRRLGSE